MNVAHVKRLISGALLATVLLSTGAAGAYAATRGPAPASSANAQAAPSSDYGAIVSAVSSAAKKLGAEGRLVQFWRASDGNFHVMLSTVQSGDAAAFRAELGSGTVVGQHAPVQPQDATVPVSGPVRVIHVSANKATPRRVQTNTLTPTSSPPFIDSTPYWGGDRIVTTWTDSTGQYWITQCTTTGKYVGYEMTAGHCNRSNSTWYQGYADNNGQLYESGTMGNVAHVEWGNNRIDSMTLSGGSYGPRVWLKTTSAIGSRAVSGAAAPYAGMSVCTDGSFTGMSCFGTITATDFCMSISDSGSNVYVCGMDEATNSSVDLVQHGDSGGPVLANVTGTTVSIVGTISAGTADHHTVDFADVRRQAQIFGVSPAVG